MHLRAAGLLVLALFASPAAARPAPIRIPVWVPASSLANAADRDLAGRLLATLCPGPQCPGEQTLEAALVPLGDGHDVLVVRLPSGGTCGRFEMRVYGPADALGRRRARGVTPAPELFWHCGETLAAKPNGTPTPDFVTTTFIDKTSGRGPALEATSWRWTGKMYRPVRQSRARGSIAS